jgi:NAD(P)-dependent dehydrogenase (short-subunit alcohol dehydrogenase family)
LGRPEDIANAAAFFFSDDSEFCTGEILPVDGGWNAKGSAG